MDKIINIFKKQVSYSVYLDTEDFDYMATFKWQLDSKGYAFTKNRIKLGNKKYLYMHRLILNLFDSDIHVDHIDGNPLNNRKNNLRKCKNIQNRWNQKLSKNSTSGYKGVTRVGLKWQTGISYKGDWIYLGIYKTKEEAALVYNKAALEYFGEFARLNKVEKA